MDGVGYRFGGNDLPSWSLSAGCRTAFQTTSYFRPSNCQESSASACGGSSGEFHGGGDGCDSTATGDAFAVALLHQSFGLIDAALGLEGVRAAGLPADLLVQGGANIPVAPHPAQMKLIWDNSRLLTAGMSATVACGALQSLAMDWRPGWMDGWMDGWVEGRMDGLTDG
eukprot:s6223_g3.t1